MTAIPFQLDSDEHEPVASVEHNEWNVSSDAQAQISKPKNAASQTLKNQDESIAISITEEDMVAIKNRAIHVGISVQSLLKNK